MPSEKRTPPCVLTVAGSDSGGGAGIQADLKTFAALGAYGTSVITALTAQNTCGVQSVFAVPQETVQAQAEAVFADFPIAAVKIGMLPDAVSVETVADILRRHKPPFVVLDPVLRSSSGADLGRDTLDVLREELLPLADVLTPNLAEAARLCGVQTACGEEEFLEQGRRLQQFGAKNILLKGGHFDDGEQCCDRLLTVDGGVGIFCTPRSRSANSHGTGCTLASALAALYPRSASLPEAAAQAKQYVYGALEASADWQIGKGCGPLAHFWRQAE